MVWQTGSGSYFERHFRMDEFILYYDKWTPIGDYGFQYYWDPFWQDPLTATHEIHYVNNAAGYSRQVTVHPEVAKSDSYMSHLVAYYYKEVEAEWLRNRNR
jgi:hypothetical protein